MEVLLAEEYGFCFGVERAVEMVEEAVEDGARPIRSLGPLIHNAQEMERLGAQGVSTIDSPDEADGDTIAVIRAHESPPGTARSGTRLRKSSTPLSVCHPGPASGRSAQREKVVTL